ncbi:MAG: dihydrofolate reductase [Candidatus Giovannonibacteria bacterium]|nr:MAG: dihydrofolate reductase [Candidatus Giovannonibacteria bacterium]
MGVKISIIVAMAENSGVIGKAGEIPWHLPTDLKRFKDLTLGHAVIVGRKTHESILKRIGKPLPNRKTIVLTRQRDWHTPECLIAHSWEEALKLAEGEKEVFVIGGAEIYKLALSHADTMYITLVLAEVDGDTFFPKWNADEWEYAEQKCVGADEKNEYDFLWWRLERKLRKGE